MSDQPHAGSWEGQFMSNDSSIGAVEGHESNPNNNSSYELKIWTLTVEFNSISL